jgi:hypothetical protein
MKGIFRIQHDNYHQVYTYCLATCGPRIIVVPTHLMIFLHIYRFTLYMRTETLPVILAISKSPHQMCYRAWWCWQFCSTAVSQWMSWSSGQHACASYSGVSWFRSGTEYRPFGLMSFFVSFLCPFGTPFSVTNKLYIIWRYTDWVVSVSTEN